MVQLILEAAQGASPCEYLDNRRGTERGELPKGAHPLGQLALGRSTGPRPNQTQQPCCRGKFHSAILSFQVRCGIRQFP